MIMPAQIPRGELRVRERLGVVRPCFTIVHKLSIPLIQRHIHGSNVNQFSRKQARLQTARGLVVKNQFFYAA